MVKKTVVVRVLSWELLVIFRQPIFLALFFWQNVAWIMAKRGKHAIIIIKKGIGGMAANRNPSHKVSGVFMIVFPSSESKTESKSLPWASLILAALTFICYFLVSRPSQNDYEVRRLELEQALQRELEDQYRQGYLPESFWIKSQEDYKIVKQPENQAIFPPEVHKAYQNLLDLPLPLEGLAKKDPVRRILLVFIPHHGSLLLLGVACLLILGFLFEHIYDRQVLLAFFFLASALWLILENLLPAWLWPSPLFTWSNTIAVISLVMWLSAPKAYITLTFRTWFGKYTEFKPRLPSVLFPLIYLIGLLLINLLVSEYKSQFYPRSMVAILFMATLFVFLTLLIKPKETRAPDPVAEVHEGISLAETYFAEERHKEGMDLLGKLLFQSPTKEQVRHIAETAWQNHDNALTEQAYKILLREALNDKEPVSILKIIEEMLYKNLPIPGNTLLAAVQTGIKRAMIADVRSLLPFLRQHKEIPPEMVLDIYGQVVDRLSQGAHPNKDYILECQEYLEEAFPDSDPLNRIRLFFAKEGGLSSELPGHTPSHEIYKHVGIDLLGVTRNNLMLKVGGNEKKVPWTAVKGLFGCHIADGETGYRACIFLKFKRKIYACNFSKERIMIKDRMGHILPFEGAWELLVTHLPEDLPSLSMEFFEDLAESEYEHKVLEFFHRKN